MSTEKQHTLAPTQEDRQNESLWDTADVASYLKVSRSTVRRKIEAGEIPYSRVGNLIRFVPSVIQEWVHSQVVRPAGQHDQQPTAPRVGFQTHAPEPLQAVNDANRPQLMYSPVLFEFDNRRVS